jgi:flagellar biosynthesis/type III secretory pathway protein FliH
MDVETMDDEEQDEEVVTYKSIQKTVGKLAQKTREFLSDEENQLDTKQIKYIINSILSALPLEDLDEDDKEEIMTKFEGGEEEGYEETETEIDTEETPIEWILKICLRICLMNQLWIKY